MDASDKIIADLLSDIENNRIKLPVLPDIAIKVYRKLDDQNASLGQIAKLISMDAGLTARMIQVANSPIYRGNNLADNALMAISRLGMKMIRTLVTTMLVEIMHQSKSVAMKQYTKKLWHHNAHVAAISYVLAKKYSTLSAEEAMLAGLVHDIGVLPILDRVAKYPELMEDKERLDELIDKYHPILGEKILNSWNFSKEIVRVAAEHENLEYKSELLPELVDIVIVANLHSHIGTPHRLSKVNWDEIPSFQTLGLTPKESIEVMKEARDEILEMKNLLVS
jgi:HD-like signal output (HDOD) protein